jgi:hypothetical protein
MPDHAAARAQTLPGPASFLYEVSSSSLTTGITLLSRRSAALADYFAQMAQARHPGDLVSLQVSYLARLMDDYVNVASDTAALEHAAERETRQSSAPPGPIVI